MKLYIADTFHKEPEPVVEEPVCPKCEGCGWMPVHSEHPPAFDVCDVCYNPEGLESP